MLSIAWAFLWSVAQPILTAPESTSGFDEVAVKHAYEGFLLAWCYDLEFDAATAAAYRALLDAHRPLPTIGDWPVDPARGVLVNDLEVRPSKAIWELEREAQPIDPPPNNFDWIRIALLDETFVAVTPKFCVPDACYFESPQVSPIKKPLVKKPGIWLALREFNGQLIIAGILIHKTAPKEPLKHPLFLKWRAELAKRFPVAITP